MPSLGQTLLFWQWSRAWEAEAGASGRAGAGCAPPWEMWEERRRRLAGGRPEAGMPACSLLCTVVCVPARSRDLQKPAGGEARAYAKHRALRAYCRTCARRCTMTAPRMLPPAIVHGTGVRRASARTGRGIEQRHALPSSRVCETASSAHISSLPFG